MLGNVRTIALALICASAAPACTSFDEPWELDAGSDRKEDPVRTSDATVDERDATAMDAHVDPSPNGDAGSV